MTSNDPRFVRSRLSQTEVIALHDRIAELEAQINTPETADFIKGVPLEAAHQRERWGADHDAGKAPLDWFWLIGYLAQKATTSAIAGDVEKAKHHTISTAAALSNWHLQLSGGDNRMRPGIAEPLPDTQRPFIMPTGPACAACKKQPSADCPNAACAFREQLSDTHRPEGK